MAMATFFSTTIGVATTTTMTATTTAAAAARQWVVVSIGSIQEPTVRDSAAARLASGRQNAAGT